ncbi:ABC transporter permease [Enemella evansiae]|uniref:ABC transporter permease n=1 Tax=Enemella evansiae TaxID=2016499 RepID=A0A255GBE6_9ACTN|nr:ABC transporter permease [Enemella evansiae]OYO13240.1 ABC transporter permease [Enemella evansiae]
MTADPSVETRPDGTAGSGPLRESHRTSWWQQNRRGALVWGLRVLVVLVFLLLWQVLSGPVLYESFVSRPSEIWARFIEWVGDGTLAVHTWITLREIILGFLFGSLAGVLLAYLLGSMYLVYDVLEPLIMALYAIPKVALAPLFIMWVGIGLEMKVLLAAISVFFLVFINTIAGIREVDRGLIDAARLMGADRWTVIRKVILPASMSGLLTGLKVAIPYALIGAVIGELVASNQGLGYLINNAAARFDTAGVFATLIVLTVLAAVLNFAVGLLARRVNRWKPLAQAE